MTAVERPIVSPVVFPARMWAPPGRWMYGVAICIALLVLEASSRGSWFTFFLGGMAGMVLLAVWIYRLVPTLIHRRLRLPLRAWVQWVALPAIVIAAYFASISPVPFGVRLAASRDGMDEAGAKIMASADVTPGWIGLYPVDRIDRYENGFRFLIWGSGYLDPVGFAYSREGEPPRIGEDRYEFIGNGWWHWTESW